jgi:superfamily I DNA and/or RNA helicase
LAFNACAKKWQYAPIIIIITPALLRVDLLQRMFQKSEEQQVEVLTAHSYQGQKGNIVIVSTVQTKKVGFVDDPQLT